MSLSPDTIGKDHGAGVEALCDLRPWPEDAMPLSFFLLGPVRLVLRLGLLLLTLPLGALLPQRLRPCLFTLVRKGLGIRLEMNLDREAVRAHTRGRVVALNHISTLDVFTALGQPGSAIIVAEQGGRLPAFVLSALARLAGTRLWRAADRQALARHFLNWRRERGTTALYVTPEETIGNQRGLFRFRSTFVDRGIPVVPMAIRLRTVPRMNADPLLSSKSISMARLLAASALTFELAFLPCLEKRPGESGEAFARRVQDAIAGRLGTCATAHSPEDKRLLRRRLRAPS